MKAHFLWLALSLTVPQILKAQTIDLVKDIRVTGAGSGLNIQETAVSGGLLYFLAADAVNGIQLWRTDGTETGTVILTNLFTDPEVPPRELTSGFNAVYFKAQFNGELWLYRSDGTKAGTGPFRPIALGFYDANSILEINGTVYFSGSNDVTKHQLWKTDGTQAGTVLVKDIGPYNSGSTGPYDLFNGNGTLYFLFQPSFNGNIQVWKSDGTEAGTVPQPVFTSKFKPAVLNGFMYFADGNALKRSDGTTVTIVKQGFTTLGDPVTVGNTLYFAAAAGTQGSELWKSDGTTTGTVLVKDINTGTNVSSSPSNLTNVNGTLFFAATTAANGRELWKSNGTSAGTVLVRDINSGTEGNLQNFLAVGNQLVFIAGDGASARLWTSNGTSAGTILLSDFISQQPVNVNGTVFFIGHTPFSHQLYKTNLTPEGTVAITKVTGPGSVPAEISDVNGIGYFSADNGITGRELWKSDGTNAGTNLVKDINAGAASSNPALLTNVNGTLFFVANNQQLWKSNGTSAGTVQVKNIPLASGETITGLINVNGTLFFGVVSPSENMQLWKSDGTSGGTVLVITLPSTTGFSPVALNGQVYFMAWDGVNSVELWKSNGTAAGTTIVKNISGNSAFRIYRENDLVVLNNHIYYILDDASDYRLVKSDGTTAGTAVIKDLYQDDLAYFSGLVKSGNYVYFSILTYNTSQETLWRSDGTGPGTIPLADFEAHYTSDPYIHLQTDAGGLFYFVPYDSETGDQLWVSNGTPEGTRMVKQIGQNVEFFRISQAAAVDNILYFNANDPAHGTELWRSDGTSAGTTLVQDLNPNGSTRFYDLANVGGTLLISADNGKLGAELYKYVPVAVGTASIRINSGGGAFSASGSRQFSADQYFSGTTQISNAASGDILNTTDDQLYKEQRFGSAFSYSIPVTNGYIKVVLHFAEIYYGVPSRGGSAGAGKRRFNVDIEGSRKLTNYDIFTTAGGAMRAKTETFTVHVTDGTLNINLLSGAIDKPIIAAIEALPADQVTLGPVADAFVRNTPNNNTNYGTASMLEVKTGSQPEYQRNTYLKFSLSGITKVSSAKLRLYGSNVQSSATASVAAYGVHTDSWTETGIKWSNAPASSGSVLGTVNVNGTAKYYEIDVTSFVQSQLAGDKTVSLFITNPANQNLQLSFNSRENASGKPQLLIRTTNSAARMDMEMETNAYQNDKHTSVVYPNPVSKQFSVKIAEQHEGDVYLRMANLAGQFKQLNADKPAHAATTVDIDVSSMHLSTGVYLLKIESKAHQEILKILVQE